MTPSNDAIDGGMEDEINGGIERGVDGRLGWNG